MYSDRGRRSFPATGRARVDTEVPSSTVPIALAVRVDPTTGVAWLLLAVSASLALAGTEVSTRIWSAAVLEHLSVAPGYPGSMAPIGSLPGPPRCFTDLQRIAAERIRSFGFTVPPTSFVPRGMDPGVFRSTAVRSVSLPAELPLMALRSPSRTSSVHRSVAPGRLTSAFLYSRTSSHEVLRPSNAPNPGNPLPGPQHPARHPGARAHSPIENHAVFVRPVTSGHRLWTSSRASTPASVRLRRFSRP